MEAHDDPFPPHTAPSDMPHLVPVVFGDWSGDGHRNTEREYFWSNRGISEWRVALSRGCRLVGVDLSEVVAADYEDPTIEVNDLAKIRASGFEGLLEADNPATPEVERRREITFGDFRALFLHLLCVGDDGLRYAEIEHSTHHMEVHPGGYGLLGE